LRLGRQSHAHSTEVTKGHILATAPERGTLAAPGTVVDLLVSRGPRPIAFLVPDFRGRQIADVRAFLDRSGIRLVEVPAEGDYAAPPGEVVGQRPAPGGRIRPQDVIEVDVSAAGRGRWR
jgi:serine/threonine-protein kinase